MEEQDLIIKESSDPLKKFVDNRLIVHCGNSGSGRPFCNEVVYTSAIAFTIDEFVKAARDLGWQIKMDTAYCPGCIKYYL